jgi:LacI family transcriptional regulator, galactose operon repressor
MKVSEPFHVAILIETSRAYGRGLLGGVANYVRDHGPWIIYRQEQKLMDQIPHWLKTWRGDGIITRLENPGAIKFMRRLGVPVVQLHTVPRDLKIPSVLPDNESIARMAFEHLRERGFRHFGFSGFNGADYSDRRRDAFVRLVREHGLHCHVFKNAWELGLVNRAPQLGYHDLDTVAAGYLGAKNRELAARWIKELPKPLGLMTCNDIRGQQMLDTCYTAGVAVPDEVAVIGVNNDEVLCDLSNPTLSSVVPNTKRIGYEAAALLDRMMSGKKVSPAPVYVEASGVITRRSTDALAIKDRPIAAAVNFIREHIYEDISIGEVAEAATLSPRMLQRRFLKIVGHSPKNEILRVRINRAKQLLTETDFPLKWIADKTGFGKLEYLIRIFRKKTGLTPGRFRARAQVADAADQMLETPVSGPGR